MRSGSKARIDRVALWLVLVLALAVPVTATAGDDPPVLTPGESVAREIAGGEVHAYAVRAAAGELLRAIVEQRGIDLAVRVVGPEGAELFDADTPIGVDGPEPVTLIAETAGEHRLEIRPLQPGESPGSYVLRIEAIRSPEPADEHRIAGERALARAQALRRPGTAEGLRAALAEYEASLPHWRALGDAAWEGQTLHSMGFLSRELGDLRRAVVLYEAALPLRRAAGDPRGVAGTLHGLAAARASLGEGDAAEALYGEALALWRAADDLRSEAFTLSSLGAALFSRGKVAEALANLERALALHRQVGDRRGEALSLNNLATIHDLVGDPERALVLHEQSLVLRRSLGDRRGEGMTLHNVAALLSALGEPRRAAELFERALALHRETGDRTSEAATLGSWGNSLEQLGAPERALALHEQALALRRALGSRHGEAMTLVNLGWVSHTLGRTQEALQFFEKAIALARELGRPLAEALLGRGAILADLGQPARALEDNLRARSLARETPAWEAEALYRIARVQRTLGDLAAARASIESALDLVESVRFKLSSPDLRASLRATVQAYYELYIDLLMEHHRRDRGQGADRAALAASERARARGLVELLAAAGAPPAAGAEPGLLERERALRQALKVELWRGPDGSGTAGLLDRYRQLEAEMRSASRTFALTSPEPLSLEDLQSHLGGDDTLLLAYALGSERSYLWAVTAGSFASYELPARAGIEEAARRLHRLLASPDRRAVQRQAELAAAGLSRLLLAPVASQLAGRRLVIVPDGALHYVPFAVLPEPGNATAMPLIVGHEIAVLPSASVLPLLRRERPDPPSADHRIAVLADPVFDRNDPRVRRPATPPAPAKAPPEPAGTARLLRSTMPGDGRLDRLTFSRVEAQRILAAAPPGTGLAALDFEANRDKVVAGDLAGYSILHFATHGLVDGERPERSGIVLSLVDEQGRERDGFVRLGDLYGLDLAADLVVLSACRSALGEEIHGEGLVGLTRGFMAAGATRVVASLWDVADEATAELMSRFYRGLLRDGLSPAAALRRAQLELARERRWDSPAFWAGFVLQGDWR